MKNIYKTITRLMMLVIMLAFAIQPISADDIVETVANFTSTNEWVPNDKAYTNENSASAKVVNATSTLTGLKWDCYLIQLLEYSRTKTIYIKFNGLPGKDWTDKNIYLAYMATTPGIVCNQVKVTVYGGNKNNQAGLSLYANDKLVESQIMSGWNEEGNRVEKEYTFEVPEEYQNKNTKFKIQDYISPEVKSVPLDGKNTWVRAITFKDGAGVSVGVESLIDDEKNADTQYYNLQGIRQENLTPGSIYIRVKGDKVSKIYF